MNNQLIEILFLGDIVGRPGRRIVTNFLTNELDEKPDFTIINAENASHGFGLTEKNYNELSAVADALTSGNHIWDKKDIFNYIEKADKLIRPLNYPQNVPGVGSRIFTIKNNIKIGVINILGNVFMSPMEPPWNLLEKEIKKIQYETPIIIIDFHAEATAEKVCLGLFADELGASAVIGTHTHIQTADEKILKNGCAYITDAGSCAATDSVIGMDKKSSLKRVLTCLPEKYNVPEPGETELNGVKICIDPNTGNAKEIKRINYKTNTKNT